MYTYIQISFRNQHLLSNYKIHVIITFRFVESIVYMNFFATKIKPGSVLSFLSIHFCINAACIRYATVTRIILINISVP